jgi:hypothetical protein
MKPATPFTSLKLMHNAMLVAQIMFAAITFYLVYSNTLVPTFTEEEKTLQVVALAVAAGAIFGGAKFFNSRMAALKEQPLTKISEKFPAYRSASIVHWALIEAATFVSIIGLFLTGNYAFLALAGFLIIYFFLQAPSKSKVQLHLDLNSNEVEEL